MPDTVHLDLIERIQIASPCPVRWEDLDGEGSTRHCRQCDLDVHNFSMMTREQVETLLRTKSGRLCGGFYRKADGTMITRDCPVGLRAVRQRAVRVMSRMAVALGLLISGGVLMGSTDRGGRGLRSLEPFRAFCNWLAPAVPPAPPGRFIAGDIAIPVPPNGAGGGGGPAGGCGVGNPVAEERDTT